MTELWKRRPGDPPVTAAGSLKFEWSDFSVGDFIQVTLRSGNLGKRRTICSQYLGVGDDCSLVLDGSPGCPLRFNIFDIMEIAVLSSIRDSEP